MNKDLFKLVVAWLLVASVFWILTRDHGIYYSNAHEPLKCLPNYMGGCD